MKAQEIRLHIERLKSSAFNVEEAKVGALWQIALQLADINEWMRLPQVKKDAIEAQQRGR